MKTASKFLIRQDDLEGMVGLSGATIWRMEKRGEFPKRVQVGRSVAWRSDEIQEWIEGLSRPKIGGCIDAAGRKRSKSSSEKVL